MSDGAGTGAALAVGPAGKGTHDTGVCPHWHDDTADDHTTGCANTAYSDLQMIVVAVVVPLLHLVR